MDTTDLTLILLYQPYFYSGGAEFGDQTRGDGVVGDDVVQLADVRYVDVAPLVAFAGIEDRDHLVCLLNHDLVQQRLLKVRRRYAIL